MPADGTSFAPLRAEPIETPPADPWASALGRYQAARDERARAEDAHLACLALVRGRLVCLCL